VTTSYLKSIKYSRYGIFLVQITLWLLDMHLLQHLFYHNCEGTESNFSQVYTSAVKIEAVYSVETWVLAYLTKWHNWEDSSQLWKHQCILLISYREDGLLVMYEGALLSSVVCISTCTYSYWCSNFHWFQFVSHWWIFMWNYWGRLGNLCLENGGNER